MNESKFIPVRRWADWECKMALEFYFLLKKDSKSLSDEEDLRFSWQTLCNQIIKHINDTGFEHTWDRTPMAVQTKIKTILQDAKALSSLRKVVNKDEPIQRRIRRLEMNLAPIISILEKYGVISSSETESCTDSNNTPISTTAAEEVDIPNQQNLISESCPAAAMEDSAITTTTTTCITTDPAECEHMESTMNKKRSRQHNEYLSSIEFSPSKRTKPEDTEDSHTKSATSPSPTTTTAAALAPVSSLSSISLQGDAGTHISDIEQRIIWYLELAERRASLIEEKLIAFLDAITQEKLLAIEERRVALEEKKRRLAQQSYDHQTE